MSVFQNVGIIRQNEIYARMIIIGEHKSCVINDHIAFAFKGGHVHADSVKTTKGNDLKRGMRVFMRRFKAALLVFNLTFIRAFVAFFCKAWTLSL